ncbi:uncharacterized protein CLUP02_00015 [Colletotrichum lupini]|uniref:Uncharacterized protein n=1 Tax=Colletotrichum lupini TaxID=145971 RepID=A0A9Q8W7N3_9PEZI|nr:uncharacterized protein CLUP02_00015 [Colletotrichum lupini]UQC73371.1 hypothetical protein CLUP02_00015 [Colletotrichum lupini]
MLPLNFRFEGICETSTALAPRESEQTESGSTGSAYVGLSSLTFTTETAGIRLPPQCPVTPRAEGSPGSFGHRHFLLTIELQTEEKVRDRYISPPLYFHPTIRTHSIHSKSPLQLRLLLLLPSDLLFLFLFSLFFSHICHLRSSLGAPNLATFYSPVPLVLLLFSDGRPVRPVIAPEATHILSLLSSNIDPRTWFPLRLPSRSPKERQGLPSLPLGDHKRRHSHAHTHSPTPKSSQPLISSFPAPSLHLPTSQIGSKTLDTLASPLSSTYLLYTHFPSTLASGSPALASVFPSTYIYTSGPWWPSAPPCPFSNHSPASQILSPNSFRISRQPFQRHAINESRPVQLSSSSLTTHPFPLSSARQEDLRVSITAAPSRDTHPGSTKNHSRHHTIPLDTERYFSSIFSAHPAPTDIQGQLGPRATDRSRVKPLKPFKSLLPLIPSHSLLSSIDVPYFSLFFVLSSASPNASAAINHTRRCVDKTCQSLVTHLAVLNHLERNFQDPSCTAPLPASASASTPLWPAASGELDRFIPLA